MINILMDTFIFIFSSIGLVVFGILISLFFNNLFSYSEGMKKTVSIFLFLLILLSSQYYLMYNEYIIISAAPILLVLIPMDKNNLYLCNIAYLIGTWLSGGVLFTALLFSSVSIIVALLVKKHILKIYIGLSTILPILVSSVIFTNGDAYISRVLWAFAVSMTVFIGIFGLAVFVIMNSPYSNYFKEYWKLFEEMFHDIYFFYYSSKKERVYFSKKLADFLGVNNQLSTLDAWNQFFEKSIVYDKDSLESSIQSGFFLIPGVGDVRHIRFSKHHLSNRNQLGFIRNDTQQISKEDILYLHTQLDTLTNLPKITLFAERFLERTKEISSSSNLNYLVFFLEIDLRTAGYSIYDIEIEAKFHRIVLDRLTNHFSNLEIFSIAFGDYILILPYSKDYSGEEIKKEIMELLNTRIELEGMIISSFNRIGFRDTYIYEVQNYDDAQGILTQILYCRSVLKKESTLFYYQFNDYEYKEYIKKQRRVRYLSTIIQNNKISTVYQPIMDTRKKTPLFFEVLTRVNHSAYKNTGLFFEDIKEFSLTRETDKMIFKHLRNSLEKGEIPIYYYSVNISSETIFDENIIWIADHLYKNGYSLFLELVEHSKYGMKYFEEREFFAKKYHAVLVADDYGTQSSNIELLYDFNFNYIKIPRKFIIDIDKDEKQKLFVRAIFQYCEQFGLGCIAEGVENEAEKQALHEIGVSLMQGYVFGKPTDHINI